MPAISVKSPGKTILFGEHAVVYFQPAIAVPLNSIHLQANFIGLPDKNAGYVMIHNRDSGENSLLSDLPEEHPIRAALQFTAEHLKVKNLPATEVHISSTIPIASGLGSSAALAVTLIRGFSRYLGFKLSNQQVNDLAYQVEIIQHGTPSGIDNSVISYNQPVYYLKNEPIEFLKLEQPITIVVADTGIRSLTKETVAEVRAKYNQQRDSIEPLLKTIGSIASSAREHLLNGDIREIGSLMNRNHLLLVELGVSCPELDHLVDAALQAGALGAKLCGSGKGGNMVAVVKEMQAEQVKSELLNAGATNAIITSVG